MSLSRAIPVFSVVFLIAYAISMHFNITSFSYYPLVGRFAAGVAPATPTLGPAMYWYGWLLDATIVAVVVAGIAALLPAKALSRLAAAVPWLAILVIAFFLWDLRSWFLR